MYVLMNIHEPKPEAVEAVTASMLRYGAAVRTKPGLIGVYTIALTDGRLMGLAIWESQEASKAGREAGRAAVKDDPFSEWEAAPITHFEGVTR